MGAAGAASGCQYAAPLPAATCKWSPALSSTWLLHLAPPLHPIHPIHSGAPKFECVNVSWCVRCAALLELIWEFLSVDGASTNAVGQGGAERGGAGRSM